MAEPRPLTAYDLAYWADRGPAQAIEYAADDSTFEPCQAIVTHVDGTDVGDGIVVRVPIALSEIELVHLARGGTLWLGTFGGLPPFQIEVQAPDQ